MAFHHRKFLNESVVDPLILQICAPYCNGTKNQDGACPISCFPLCYPICNQPLFLEIPPPPAWSIPDYDPPDKPYRLSRFLTVSLALLATTFLFFACYSIYKLYSNRRRRWPPRQRRQPPEEAAEEGGDDFLVEDYGVAIDHPIWYIRTVGLQPSVISAITVVKYKKGDGLVEGTDCSVCLSEFEEDETLRLLPKCNHAFHIPCIDTWLRSHTNCPMCRAGIVVNSTGLPPQEQIVHNPGPVEEARIDISEGEREREREREGECELTVEIEDEGESQARKESKRNEILPLRRSVSLDSLSASVISASIANAFPAQSNRSSDNQLDLEKGYSGNNQSFSRLEASSSIERAIQTGPSIMERSLSCSAKVLLSRYNNRSRNSNISR